jgi:hypothetical protein
VGSTSFPVVEESASDLRLGLSAGMNSMQFKLTEKRTEKQDEAGGEWRSTSSSAAPRQKDR